MVTGITTPPASAPTLSPNRYYTPEKIDWAIRNWELLTCLAENPKTASHHLDAYHRCGTGGSCASFPLVPGNVGKRYSGDQLKWSDVRADVLCAVQQLAPGPGRQIVELRIKRPTWTMARLARGVHKRYQTTLEEYQSALDAMAVILGAAMVEGDGA